MKTLIDFIQSHPYITEFIILNFLTAIASSMTTPSANDSNLYKFIFNLVHALTGIAGRIPQFRQFFGLQENPTTITGIEAKQEAKAIDPTVQGITQKPKE